jgi:hypothetical protein
VSSLHVISLYLLIIQLRCSKLYGIGFVVANHQLTTAPASCCELRQLHAPPASGWPRCRPSHPRAASTTPLPLHNPAPQPQPPAPSPGSAQMPRRRPRAAAPTHAARAARCDNDRVKHAACCPPLPAGPMQPRLAQQHLMNRKQLDGYVVQQCRPPGPQIDSCKNHQTSATHKKQRRRAAAAGGQRPPSPSRGQRPSKYKRGSQGPMRRPRSWCMMVQESCSAIGR